MLSGLNFIKDPICLPPPVMFSLSKLSLSVVAVNIRPSSIDTGPGNGSATRWMFILHGCDQDYLDTNLSFVMSLGQSLADLPGNLS